MRKTKKILKAKKQAWLTKKKKEKFVERIKVFFKSDLFNVILLGAIALIVRLYKLSKEVMWTDEGTYVIYGLTKQLTQIIKMVTDGQHPPFYFILYNLWVKVFGFSQVSLISSSILVGVTSIVIMYFLVKKMFGRQDVAFISALLACFSLFHFHYSRDATEYVFFFMMILLSLLSFMLFLKSEKKGRIKFSALYIIITALLFYTHHYAFMVILVENLVFFMFIFLKKHRELVKLWIIIQIIIFTLMLPGIIPTYVHGMTYDILYRNPGESRPYSEEIYWQFRDVYNLNTGNLQESFAFFHLPRVYLIAKTSLTLINLILIIGVILALVKVEAKVEKAKHFSAMQKSKKKICWSSGEEIRELALLLMLIIVPLLLTAAFPTVYRIKALLLTVFPYSTLLALGVTIIPGKGILGKAARCVLVLILVVLGSLSISHSLESNYFFGEQEDWRGVAEFLKQPEQKAELIVVNVQYNMVSFLYYYNFSLVDKSARGEYVPLNSAKSNLITIPHVWTVVGGGRKNFLALDTFNQSLHNISDFWLVSSPHTKNLFPNEEIFTLAGENFVNVTEKHFGSVYATRYKRK